MSESPARAKPVTGGQIAKGAAWLLGFKLVDKGIGLFSTLILARVLTPADFGLVAMAMVVVAFTELMGAFGFDSALIQRQDATRAHYDTAWTFNLIFGTSAAVVLLALAVPMARFYSDPRLVAVLGVLACASLVGGFENIGVVAFRKELDFRSEFRFLVGKRIAGFVVTVAMAITLRSYWALVAGTVTARAMSVWISYRLHPYRPRPSLAARADLMHFSRWIFFSSLISFVSSRSTDFVLGRTVGPTGLGVYSVSFQIAMMPSTELIAPLNRAVYPVYSRLAGDLPALRARFLEVFGVICLIAIPIAAGLFGAADAAVRVVLGTKWLAAVPMIRIFGVCGLIGALQGNMYLTNVAIGKPQANTTLSATLVLFTLPVIVWSSLHYGVVGAGYALLFESLASLTGIIVINRRNTGLLFEALIGVAWRPIVGSTAMVVLMTMLDSALAAHVPDLAQVSRLLALILVGASSYIAVVFVVWCVIGAPRGAESLVLGLIRHRALAWWTRSHST